MACQGRCESQVPRCQCEDDCWAGDPVAYDACFDYCLAHPCTFPDVLPSIEFPIEDCASAGFGDCQEGCQEAATDATIACNDLFPDDGPDLCTCYSERDEAEDRCRGNCYPDFGMDDWASCIQVELDLANECCGVPLSGCDHDCVSIYLTNLKPSRGQFLKALYDCEAEFAIDTRLLCAGCDEDPEACAEISALATQARENCFRHAWAERFTAELVAGGGIGMEGTRRTCLADCTEDELAREDAELRKQPECGGPEFAASARCGAVFAAAWADIFAAYDTCLNTCTEDDVECQNSCDDAYQEDYQGPWEDDVACRVAVCRQYNPAPHGHALIAVKTTCFTDWCDTARGCFAARRDCLGEPGFCAGEYQDCLTAGRNAFLACFSASELRDDCPDCFRRAVLGAGTDHRLPDYYPNSTLTGGDPTPESALAAPLY